MSFLLVNAGSGSKTSTASEKDKLSLDVNRSKQSIMEKQVCITLLLNVSVLNLINCTVCYYNYDIFYAFLGIQYQVSYNETSCCIVGCLFTFVL